MISMGDKKETAKAVEKTKAGPSNNGPLFDYRRDKPCN